MLMKGKVPCADKIIKFQRCVTQKTRSAELWEYQGVHRLIFPWRSCAHRMTTGSTVSSSRTLINQRESMWGNSVGVPTRFELSPDLYHWSSDEVLSWYCTHSHLTGIGSSSIFWHSDCLCPLSCSWTSSSKFLTAIGHSPPPGSWTYTDQWRSQCGVP